MAIQEPNATNKLAFLSLNTSEGVNILALIDTRSQINITSESIVSSNKIHTLQTTSHILSLADGKQLTIDKSAHLVFFIRGNKIVEFSKIFLVPLFLY